MPQYLTHPTKTLFSIKPMAMSKVAFLGLPFDGGNTCRQGSRFAPWYVRLSSEFLEEYSILYRRDIRECDISDWGNVVVSYGDFGETLRRADIAIKSLGSKKYIILGGDHTVSIITASIFRDNIKKCLILDAHPDFYLNYEGNNFLHACVSRRIGEILGFDKIVIMGIRSVSKDSLRELDEFGVEYYTIFDMWDDHKLLEKYIRASDYLSIDMDFFDPAYVPNVSCPEPLGLSVRDFFMLIPKISSRIIDITEIIPQNPFDYTSIVTASLIRELGIQLSISD